LFSEDYPFLNIITLFQSKFLINYHKKIGRHGNKLNLFVQALLAFIPILAAAVLLVGFRLPAKKAMPLVFLLTAALSLIIWRVDLARIAASIIQGLFITFDILWIIFGAILLLNTL